MDGYDAGAHYGKLADRDTRALGTKRWNLAAKAHECDGRRGRAVRLPWRTSRRTALKRSSTTALPSHAAALRPRLTKDRAAPHRPLWTTPTLSLINPTAMRPDLKPRRSGE